MLGCSSLRIDFRFRCAIALLVMFAILAHQHSAVELEKQQYSEDPDDINVIPEMGQLKIKKSRVIRAGGDKTKKSALPSTANEDHGKGVNLNETIEEMNNLTTTNGKKNSESINSKNTYATTLMTAKSVEHRTTKVNGHTTLLSSGADVTSFTVLPNVTGNSSFLTPSANASHPHKTSILPPIANVTGESTLPPVANVTDERPTSNATGASAAASSSGNETDATPLPDSSPMESEATGKPARGVMPQEQTVTATSGGETTIVPVSEDGGDVEETTVDLTAESSAAIKLHRLSFVGALFALIGAIFLVFT